jgi:aryl-alcohol dehydrogenase-like predicted oxidoreductase
MPLSHSAHPETISMTSPHTTLGGRYTLPGSSISLHRMGYGAMQLAGSTPEGPKVWGPPKDPVAAEAVLKEAIALGVDHIDTAEFYGPHHTNQLIRKALHPYPAGLTLVTKIGFTRDEKGGWNPANSADDLRRAVHENLDSLGLESLDVVNLRLGSSHSADESVSVAGPLRALAKLQEEGLVKHIGLSTISQAQFKEAEQIAPIVCVQNEYNLVHRGDDAFIDALAEQGVAYVPYFPLGGFSPLQSDVLAEVAAKLGATPMQVALAWLLQRAPNILLIPGTSSLAHLRENLKAAELVIPKPELAKLDGIAKWS